MGTEWIPLKRREECKPRNKCLKHNSLQMKIAATKATQVSNSLKGSKIYNNKIIQSDPIFI